MISGGQKIQKTQKTKFRKNTENKESIKFEKKKHHDKSFYRLAREEKTEYVT
jgi:hypothetical protein